MKKTLLFLLFSFVATLFTSLCAQSLPKLAISFKTDQKKILFNIKSSADYYVDLGDGKLIHKQANDDVIVDGPDNSIFGKTTGNIKIYGENIHYLRIINKGVTELDVANCPELTHLKLQSNKLNAIDVSKNTGLTFLDVSYNNLSAIDIVNLTKLDTLLLTGNKLASIDFPLCPNLKLVSLAGNAINDEAFKAIFMKLPTIGEGLVGKFYVIDSQYDDKNIVYDYTVDIAKGKNWKTLDFYMGKGWDTEYLYDGIHNEEIPEGTSKFVLKTKRKELTLTVISTHDIWVNWGENHVVHLTPGDEQTHFTGNVYGDTVEIYGNDVLGIDCGKNEITAIIFPESSTFTTLLAHGNAIEKIDLSKVPNIESLFLHNNLLTAIDLRGLSKIKFLDIHGNNRFSAIDLRDQPALEFLSVGQTSLKALDLSKNNLINVLECTSLSLDTLSVEGLNNLVDLRVYENNLTESICSNIVAQLPTHTPEAPGFLYFVNEKSENEKNYPSKTAVETAKEKGWTVYDFNDGEEIEFFGYLHTNSVHNHMMNISTTNHSVSIHGLENGCVVQLYDIVGRLVQRAVSKEGCVLFTDLQSHQFYFVLIGSESLRVLTR